MKNPIDSYLLSHLCGGVVESESKPKRKVRQLVGWLDGWQCVIIHNHIGKKTVTLVRSLWVEIEWETCWALFWVRFEWERRKKVFHQNRTILLLLRYSKAKYNGWKFSVFLTFLNLLLLRFVFEVWNCFLFSFFHWNQTKKYIKIKEEKKSFLREVFDFFFGENWKKIVQKKYYHVLQLWSVSMKRIIQTNTCTG